MKEFLKAKIRQFEENVSRKKRENIKCRNLKFPSECLFYFIEITKMDIISEIKLITRMHLKHSTVFH